MGLNKEIKFDKNLIIIIVLFIVVFVLGFLGWMEFYENIGREVSNLRITVLTAGLFYKNIFWPIVAEYMGNVQYNIPVLLNIARLTAPLLLAYAVFFVVISIFKKTALIYFYKFFKKDYTIIVGYNERVHSFINNSKDSGQKFILFTEKDNIPLFENKKLIIYDNEKEIMKKVMRMNPYKAKNILLWHDDDEKNKENLMAFLDNPKKISKIKEHINAFIHLGDPLLNEKMKKTPPNPKFRVHTFNTDLLVASYVIDKYSPDQYINLTDGDKQLKIIIFGFNNLGYHILNEMLQMYIFPNLNKLQITLIDNDIEKKKQKFFSRYGAITQYADIDTMEYSDFLQNSGHEKISNPDMCFTCFQKPMENDYIAKRTRRSYFKMYENFKKPIIIQIITNMEKDSLSKTIEKENKLLEIKTVGMDKILNYKTIIEENEKIEEIAKQIHNEYLNLDEKILDEEWDKLVESIKEDNYYPARHLYYKMRYIDYQIKDADSDNRDESEIVHEFDKTSIDMLAKVEHLRWTIRKVLTGYIHGVEFEKEFRDTIKIHKNMIPWEQLNDEDKEKDKLTTDKLYKILPANKKIQKKKEEVNCDIFLSHSTENKNSALRIMKKLEENDLKVLLAPRNIKTEIPNEDNLFEAIEKTKIFLLLVSKESQLSEVVKRELKIAYYDKETVIIPYRLDNSDLVSYFEFYLKSTQKNEQALVDFNASIEMLVNKISEQLNKINKL